MLPRASSSGSCVCLVLRNFFQLVWFLMSLLRPAYKSPMRRAEKPNGLRTPFEWKSQLIHCQSNAGLSDQNVHLSNCASHSANLYASSLKLPVYATCCSRVSPSALYAPESYLSNIGENLALVNERPSSAMAANSIRSPHVGQGPDASQSTIIFICSLLSLKISGLATPATTNVADTA